MRISIYLLLVLSIISCSNSKQLTTRLDPFEPENHFFENEKLFSYQQKGDIIVSIGYDKMFNDEYIFDITIDNLSDSLIVFNPDKVYLFCYDSDSTLSNKTLHYGKHSDALISALDYEIESLDKKVKTKTILSILLGVAYVGAEFALMGSDIPEIDKDFMRISHMATQVVLDETAYNNMEDLENLAHERCLISEDMANGPLIQPGDFHNGKMQFSIPNSPYYKIYIPVNDDIYSFRFKSINN